MFNNATAENNVTLKTEPYIVTLGGGTGNFTLLQALKLWTPNITAIVNMSDSGGSTGILRDELGVLPPGDIRQCLVALSNQKEVRELFSYRFGKGGLANHAVGNIVLSALELQTGSFIEAVRIASEFLKISGKVVPVVSKKQSIILHDGDHIIRDEHRVKDYSITHSDALISLEPKVKLNPDAAKAIRRADAVVICPGDMFASLLPVLAVEGMASALRKSKAKVFMLANLVNKPQQTPGWHVVDYVKGMERYIGSGTINYVIYNNLPPDKELIQKYAHDKEFPVDTSPERFLEITAECRGAALVATKLYDQDPADRLIKRTLIRHDAPTTVKLIADILVSAT